MSFEYSGAGAPLSSPSVSFTTDQAAAQITRDNLSWGTIGHAATVTFAFRATDATYDSGTTDFSQFNAQQIAAATLSFQAWSDVANITFDRVGSGTSGPAAYSDNAQILLGDYSGGRPEAAAFAYTPGAGQGGDVWVNRALDYNAGPVLWNYGQMTLTHEIGHAIGLEHPGDYDASDDGEVTYSGDAEYREDSRQYSIMSYFDETETGADFHGNYAAAPLLDDIAAAQRLYGANYATRSGDTVYGFHSTADRPWYLLFHAADVAIFCVWDGGGTDTLDFSGYTGSQFIDLHAESFSNVSGLKGNVSIAKGVIVENAILGAGGGAIWGNEAANLLVGGHGQDGLYGYEGNDTLVAGGGWGTDTFDGGDGIDTIDFRDMSHAVSANLSANGAEIVLGTAFADRFTSSEATVLIEGRQGDDSFFTWFDGETIDGGAGVDTLFVGGDWDVEFTFDLATASLVAIENLAGSVSDDRLYGNAKANLISGGGGDDTLEGGGGADTLDGSDAVGVNMASFSRATGGVSIDLAAGTAVGSDGALITLLNIDEAEGSAYADVMSAGAVHGRLVGGAGNDVFVLPEAPGGWSARIMGGKGVDTISFAGAGQGVTADLGGDLGLYSREIENLTGGEYDDLLGGSDLANRLSGAGGADTLAGGLGDDVMIGGQGEDTVSFLHAAAGVTADLGRHRASGEGSDKLKSVENLTGSNHDDRLTGDLNVNHLDGGAGADRLAGGFGADVLTGGLGADVFIYGKAGESAPAAADLITDLENADVIELSRIDADVALRGNQAFVVAAKFTGQHGQLIVRYDAKHDVTSFHMDVDGDRMADMTITASGDHRDFAGFVL